MFFVDKAMEIGVVDDCTVLRRIELKNNLLKLTEMEAKDGFRNLKSNGRLRGMRIQTRFKKPAEQRFKLNFQFHKILLKDQVDDLERGVSRDEIKIAVWNCGDNKSPGPDGFNFEFFKKYYDVVETDFCEAIEHFFTSGGFS
nr:RNA-directed DNA polymerase, eukaryota [Tanacetum cinerariifolium]